MEFASLHHHSTYSSRHWRVRFNRDKASLYACVDCGAPANEWSQDHRTDGENPYDYRPRCYRHHQAYDGKWSPEERQKLSETLRGREVSAETGRKISQAKKGMKYNMTPEGREGIRMSKLGNKHASGQRTPEQCERIRVARWGR